MSNNRHRQQWTPADVNGRWFPGQACPRAGSRHRDLASGRRGQRFGSRRSLQRDPRLSACPLRCRIKPYLNQGGACGAAGPASAAGSALGGPPGASRATPPGRADQGNSRVRRIGAAGIWHPRAPRVQAGCGAGCGGAVAVRLASRPVSSMTSTPIPTPQSVHSTR